MRYEAPAPLPGEATQIDDYIGLSATDQANALVVMPGRARDT